MFGVFAGIAHNNTVSVMESSFTANTGGGGGALQLVFAGTTHNSLRVISQTTMPAVEVLFSSCPAPLRTE